MTVWLRARSPRYAGMVGFSRTSRSPISIARRWRLQGLGGMARVLSRLPMAVWLRARSPRYAVTAGFSPAPAGPGWPSPAGTTPGPRRDGPSALEVADGVVARGQTLVRGDGGVLAH